MGLNQNKKCPALDQKIIELKKNTCRDPLKLRPLLTTLFSNESSLRQKFNKEDLHWLICLDSWVFGLLVYSVKLSSAIITLVQLYSCPPSASQSASVLCFKPHRSYVILFFRLHLQFILARQRSLSSLHRSCPTSYHSWTLLWDLASLVSNCQKLYLFQ